MMWLGFLLWQSSVGGQAIRQVDFRNFTYETCFDRSPVRVNKGRREVKPEISGGGGGPLFEVRGVIYGDLDGDGQEEAVVDTLCSGGGTGRFTDALLFRWQGGKAVLIGKAGAGDRADNGLHRVTFAAGRLHVARYRGQGGLCCPEYIETQRYRLAAGKLVPEGPPWQSDFVSRYDTHAVRRVVFPAGSTSTTVHGATVDNESYRIYAEVGQTIYLYVGGENAALEFMGGVNEWKNQPKLNEQWVAEVPGTGEYALSVSGTTRGKPATFSINIEIRYQ